MTDFEKYITKAGEGYSLSADEKARMERVVKAYMKFNPRRGRRSAAAAPTSFFGWLVILHRPLAAALVLVLVSGTGISYAAEGALPGDALYTIKTKINEPARVALAVQPEAKAEVQMKIAERRIEEATTLAAEGRLDESTEENLAVAFETRAQAAAKAIETIDEEGDSPASAVLASRFETKLAAHEEVLAEVEFEDEDGREAPRSHRFSQALRNASERIAIAREKRDSTEVVSDVSVATARAIEDTTAPEPAAAMMISGTVVPPAEDARATASATLEAAAEKPAPSERAVSRMKTAAEKSLKNAEQSLRKARSLSAEAKARAEADIAQAHELLSADDFDSYKESLRISEQTTIYIKAAPSLEKVRARNALRNRAPDASTKSETSVEALPVTATASTTASESSTTSDDSDHGNDDRTDSDSDDEEDEEKEPEEKPEGSGFNLLQKLNVSL